MRPIRIVVGTLADDADGISATQQPLAAGNLTIDGALASGGTVTLTYAQPVTITSNGNESAKTFTVYGTGADGIAISQAVAGPNATTTATTYFFKTITRIAIDAASVGTSITAGVAATGGTTTAAIPVSYEVVDFNLGVQFNLTAGTMTISGYYTMDNPEGTYTNSFLTDAMWTDITAVSAKTADAAGAHIIPSTAIKFVQTTGSATGTCAYTLIQSTR